MSEATRDEVCIVALAELFRGDGEILASPIGEMPSLGARLARKTFAPRLLMTDGVATLVDDEGNPEAWMPYRSVFDVVWSGKRHVVMGAAQIDRHGNQNIDCIGDPARPKAMLLGMRGAPGNTINHTTSYWVPDHSPKVFVDRVDVASGVGYDRVADLQPRQRRFHEIRAVVSNLGVFDFTGPDHTLRLVSIHPGVSPGELMNATGFRLAMPRDLPITRTPTEHELELIRQMREPSP